jgi:hypothetical protein
LDLWKKSGSGLEKLKKCGSGYFWFYSGFCGVPSSHLMTMNRRMYEDVMSPCLGDFPGEPGFGCV